MKFIRALSLILALVAPWAHGQVLDATMISSLVATQGETITYTTVISNRTSSSITGLSFSDTLDPNTTFVPGSINTSPLAFSDSYAALGNVQITIPAPALLTNDVDVDGVGPALTVTAATTTSANGGNVTITANGGFTYNPPRGFEGIDTFTYQLNDSEGFTDVGTVSITVTGMIWFVNASAPAAGDGRLTSPFNTLAALATINNGVGNNPAQGDSIFLYSGAYSGPLTLLSRQKIIGQGAGQSLSVIAGVSPPPGSLALPTTGAASPLISGSSGIALATDNLVRGLNISVNGGTSLGGGSVGALAVSEAAVTNTAGTAINLAGGAVNVTLRSVAATGGLNGIRLVNCTGSFTVLGTVTHLEPGSGGTIQNTTGNGIHLDNVSAVSLYQMIVNNAGGNGLFGQNVSGLVIDSCTFNNNGDATGEAGIRLGDPLGANGVTGTARIANTLVRASSEMNIAIYNSAGILNPLDVLNVVSKDTRTRPLGADGFYFETRGNAIATVNVSSCSFSNNLTQGFQASALGQSVLSVNLANCGFTNNNEGVVLANASDADLNFDLNNNRFFNNLATGASGSAIAAVNGTTVTSAANYSGKIRNNTIVGGGIDNHLIAILFAGFGNNVLEVTNNSLNAVNAQFNGLFVQAGETGSGNLDANVTVTGNTISLGALGSHGMAIQSRITSSLCAEIANNASTTGGIGLFGINVRQRDTSTFRLPGLPPNSTAAVVAAFLQAKNPASTVTATAATGFVGGAACTVPPAAAPQPQFEPELQFEVVSDNGDSPAQQEPESAPAPASIAAIGDVNVAIGTLPASKKIIITFRAVVANPMPAGVCILTNQGSVSANGSLSFLTDDPRTPALADPTLTVLAMPPTVTTQPASNVTGNGATLNGAIHPCGSPTQYYFEYGTTTGYGNVTPSGALAAGLAEVAVSAPVSGLQPGTTYHFRLRARNDVGTTDGADRTFTTPLAIVQQPVHTAACVGGTATFSVAASSPSVTYQWQRRSSGSAAFADISGATAATYTTGPLSASDDGTAFRAIVSAASTSVTSAEAFISVISIATPSATYDFNSGVPANTALYGSALVSAGVLELNPNIGSQTGAFLTSDLAPGRVVRGFAATFKARLLAGTSPPADGFSFNWAADLPNGTYAVAEEGQGTGLSVAFDTYDNGFAEAPAVDVFWGGGLVAHKPVPISFLVRGPNFFDVQIRLSADGVLDVIYGCEPVFTRLPVTGYTPQMGARFGLGSRTGGLWETHSIDDLALELYLDESGLPRITRITTEPAKDVLIEGRGTPGQNYALERSGDLNSWTWHASVQADAAGDWQFLETDVALSPAFYRLKAAPQFPEGLVTWYRAEEDYNDSFGPHHGEPEGSTGFDRGQRGAAFSFNGKDNAVFIKSGRPIPLPWTAAFWVNRQDSPDVSAALLSDNVGALKLEQWPTTRQVGFTQFGVADYYFRYIAPAGTWVHLTFVGTRMGISLYADGSLVDTIPAVMDLPLEFLGRRETGQDRLRGLLDEITIFNRALTIPEIQQVRSATLGP